jgi:serine protease Do
MPKITYLDELEKHIPKYRGVDKQKSKFIILFLFLSLIMGIIGGVGTLAVLSSSSTIKNKLGINLQDLNINHITTNKVVLEESSAIIDSSKKVSPSVVSITSTQNVLDFFGNVTQSQSAGTGFIFTNDGYIITNKHVGSDTSATYSVYTSDGKKYDAKVVSQDPTNDLAIMKINATGLPVVDLGDSDKLEVGQWVIAIGNALGQLQNTVTVGVISARERAITAGSDSSGNSESLENVLQTDAAINSGNSGGPLVNLTGQVVGVNTAMASGAQSIGFAIPINVVKTAIQSFQKNGKIVRPILGVRYTTVTSEIKQSQNLPVDYGALIYGGTNSSGVVAGGAADKAGLQNNDIITAVNGDRIDQNNPLGSYIQQFSPGDKVDITYLRNNKEKTVSVTLGSTG